MFSSVLIANRAEIAVRVAAPARDSYLAIFGTRGSCRSPATVAQLAMPNCRETGGFGRSHSLSFDHRRRPETLRTAMATAFF